MHLAFGISFPHFKVSGSSGVSLSFHVPHGLFGPLLLNRDRKGVAGGLPRSAGTSSACTPQARRMWRNPTLPVRSSPRLREGGCRALPSLWSCFPFAGSK